MLARGKIDVEMIAMGIVCLRAENGAEYSAGCAMGLPQECGTVYFRALPLGNLAVVYLFWTSPILAVVFEFGPPKILARGKEIVQLVSIFQPLASGLNRKLLLLLRFGPFMALTKTGALLRQGRGK